MYKVTYQAGKGFVDIIQVSVKNGESWELLKDRELVDRIEKKFMENGSSFKDRQKMGYGEAVYTEKLSYVTGKFEVVE